MAAAGAKVHRGSTEDLDSLKTGAARSDGVIHLAFNHDFSKFKDNCEDDRRVIRALGSVLAGSKRPLIVTSGTGMVNGVARAAGHRRRCRCRLRCDSPGRVRRGRRRLSLRMGSMCRWCDSRRCMTRSSRASSPMRSRSPVKRACAHMSAKDTTVGRRRMSPMWRGSTGSRSRRRSRARDITRSRKRASRSEPCRRRSAGGCGYLSNPFPPEEAQAHFGWLAHVCVARPARLERADAEKAGMAADRAEE